MPKFDIDSLLEFSLPTHMCEKCCALHPLRRPLGDEPTCQVCGVRYLPTEDFKAHQVGLYLRQGPQTRVRFKAPITHCQALAQTARLIRQPLDWFPPLRALLTAFGQAEQFIHFTSFNISHVLIGALKMAAQRVKVRGVVSNVDANTLC